MNTQKFSFLIISFNRAEDTIDAIKNVLQLENVQGWEKEIIVLNNGSTTDYSIIPAFIQTLTLEENAIIQYSRFHLYSNQ